MKIAIGTNIFNSVHRQDICIQSLKRLKELYPDMIDLYNIQPTSNPQIIEGFQTLDVLNRTAKDIVVNCTSQKPLIKEMIKSLSDLEGYDYFIFTNSDIIISDRFIKLILDNKDKDSFCGSRLTIQNIQTLEETPKLVQYQVAGFDTFAIKTTWWKLNEANFPEYIYGNPCWDVHYATLCMKLGDSMFVNKWPASIFHIQHEIAWSDMTIERQYCENMLFKTYKQDSNMWHRYLFTVLLKRSPANGFYTPFSNEEELEKQYFKL